MFSFYVGSWWSVALRGLIVLLLGIVAFVWPAATLTTLILLFGAFAIADGLVMLVALFVDPPVGNRWLQALYGIVNVLLGVGTFVYPGATTLALLYTLSAWAILNGCAAIVAAFELRKEYDDAWLIGVSGGLALLFGVLVILSPGITALVLLGYMAAYAVINGIMLITLGLRLRRVEKKVEEKIEKVVETKATIRQQRQPS